MLDAPSNECTLVFHMKIVHTRMNTATLRIIGRGDRTDQREQVGADHPQAGEGIPRENHKRNTFMEKLPLKGKCH